MTADSEYVIIEGTKKLINSMRNSGYKNPTYAIAELVDNSVDAKATKIEILCNDDKSYNTNRLNLSQIAILDNGCGMDKDTLRRSLKFGDGTKAKGGTIGKFGMGLPNSSISQCQRVDVYTWTDSINKSLHCYLDLDDIEKGMTIVPEPTLDPIPDMWKNAAKHISKKSGTLVIWSHIDRCPYKTSKALIKNSAYLIARIYRKFIDEKKLIIRTVSFTAKNNEVQVIESEDSIKPNDPMYLMVPSSTPEPWGDKAMFEGYGGDAWTEDYSIDYNGAKHNVKLRYTIIKADARTHDLTGATKYGKHAGNNVGVSLVREGRELELDRSFVNVAEYRDRWWGAEVEFTSELDGFFGVTYDKQHAVIFSDVAEGRTKILEDEKTNEHEVKRQLEIEGEHDKVQMLDLVRSISKKVNNMRNSVKKLREGTRKKQSSGKKPEDEAAADRKEKHPGGSDVEEAETPEEKRIQDSMEVLKEAGYHVVDAKKMASDSIKAGEKFVWIPAQLSGSQFFDVLPKAGQLYVKFNTNHAAYKNLMHIVDEIPDDLDPEDALNRLRQVWTGLRLVLASWARYEDETQDIEEKRKIQDIRITWGTMLEAFLRKNS